MVNAILFAILAALVVTPVQAALTSSNIPAHTHGSVQQGGSAIAPASVTVTGAVSGGSIAATGAVSGATVTAAGAVSGGSVATSGTVSSTKACATGYTRVTPNYCARTGAAISNVYTTTACTLSAALTGVTDAKAVHLNGYTHITTLNAVAVRSLNYWFVPDSDTTCANPGNGIYVQSAVREMVATVAATNLADFPFSGVVKTDSTGRYYYGGSTTSGGSWFVSCIVAGYFD